MSVDETQAPVVQDPATDTPVQTDTSETNQLATNDAPEATQGTEAAQETATAEISATDTAQEKLYAGKYKTPEELERSYKELESKFGQTASEKAELTRILNDSFVAPEPTRTDTVNDLDELEDNPLKKEVDKLNRVTAVQTFAISHPDADGDAMRKVLADDPLVSQISGHEAKLEYAYLRSKSITQPKVIAQAQKEAQSQAQAKIVEKQAAQVETASKATETNNAELMTQATTAKPQDREAARLALIRKHLTNI